MDKRIFAILAGALLLFAGGAAFSPNAFADPPWDPVLDDSRNAPVERDGAEIGLDTVATGLVAPLKGVAAPGLDDILFVIDQPGQMYAIDLDADGPVVCPGAGCMLVMDVAGEIVTMGVLGPDSFDERGLLGLAFHWDFASNGRFYTYTSEPNGGIEPTFPTTLPAVRDPALPDNHQNVVSERRFVNPADPSAGVMAGRKQLMRVDWPQFNHDGGDIAINDGDGMLYISMGDGGGADDRDGQQFVFGPIDGHGLDGNGQKLTNPLGKILRIDVDGDNSANGQYGIPKDNPFVGAGGGVVEEIFAFGFRNPYRMSFDKDDPDHLYVGNVGQNDLEEVELVRSGANHGWPIMEGTQFFAHNFNEEGDAAFEDPGTATAAQALQPELTGPVSQYDTHHEGHAIVAGFLYRGDAVSDLEGQFVFGDFSLVFIFPTGPMNHGRLFSQNRRSNPGGGLRRIEELRIVPGNSLALGLLGWGQDADGELYPMGNISGIPFGNEGRVLKIVPPPEADEAD